MERSFSELVRAVHWLTKEGLRAQVELAIYRATARRLAHLGYVRSAEEHLLRL